MMFRGANPPKGSIIVEANWRDNIFFTEESESVRMQDFLTKPDRYDHIWEGGYEPQAIGAIWTRDVIERNRVKVAPDMKRVLVSVDPPAESGENSDECGIIGGGLGADRNGYVLADESRRGRPEEWGRAAVGLYDILEADAIVAEVNMGGDMVRSVIHSIRPGIRVIKVRAKRGKSVRAEPVSAMYSLNRIKHVGNFPELERQLCVEEGTLIETDRGQVPIEDVTLKDRVMTRNGFASLRWCGYTGTTSDLIEIKTNNSTLRTTRCHPIYLPETNEFVSAENVLDSHRLLQSYDWGKMENLLHGGADGGTGWKEVITGIHSETAFSIGQYIKRMLPISLMEYISIIKTEIRQIISYQTWKPLLLHNTLPGTRELDLMYTREQLSEPVLSVDLNSRVSSVRKNAVIAQISAPRECIVEEKRVYNLSVSEGYLPEYFANGILTHNCLMTAEGYEGSGSPDHVDAAVYLFLELFNQMTRKQIPESMRPTHAANQYNPHHGLNRRK
jgi:hypothetical protein